MMIAPFKTSILVAVDFAMGFALFAGVVACASLGHGTGLASAAANAQAETSSWLSAISMASPYSGIGWHPTTREGALILLAATFGGITALNMAIARHLQTVAAGADAPPDHAVEMAGMLNNS